MIRSRPSRRSTASAAASFLMDYLKSRAPFWKQVERAGGATLVAAKSSDDAATERCSAPPPRRAATLRCELTQPLSPSAAASCSRKVKFEAACQLPPRWHCQSRGRPPALPVRRCRWDPP